jgi:hypothetical protein
MEKLTDCSSFGNCVVFNWINVGEGKASDGEEEESRYKRMHRD